MLNQALEYTQEVQHFGLLFYDLTGTPVRSGESFPGGLVTGLQYTADKLRPEDMAAWVEGIDPGDYHVLAIFNSDDNTQTSDYDDYSTIITHLVGDSLNFRPPADFLTGEALITVTGREQVETISLLRHNNDITLNIVYDGYELQSGMALDARIYGNNGAFDYSEHATPEDLYVQSYDWAQQIDSETNLPLNFSLTTMRLCHQRQVILYLEEVSVDGTRAGGEEPRSLWIDLAAELAKVTDKAGNLLFDTDEKLEMYNAFEFELTLAADFTIVSVSVSVDNWDHSGGEIEL